MIGRAFAWILLVLAVIAGGHDAWGYLRTGAYAPAELGAVWYAIHPNSLQLIQPAIERHIAPWLWQDVLFPLLLWPAWAVLAGAALIVALLFGRRRKHRWRSGSLG